MRGPLESLKRLPWLGLLQVALLTALAGLLVEYFLFFSATVPLVEQILITLGSPAIAFLTVMVVALAMGALAVMILERFNRIVINASSLWALIGCVALVLFVLQAIGLFPIGFIGMSYPQLIGIMLGVFFKGQPYWKSYRRW